MDGVRRSGRKIGRACLARDRLQATPGPIVNLSFHWRSANFRLPGSKWATRPRRVEQIEV